MSEMINGQGRSLTIAGMALRSLPSSLRHRTELESLEVFGTGLAEVPNWIGELRNLRHIDFSGNELSSIPPELSLLENLEQLDLAYNKLSYVPAELANLRKLKLISLHGNLLKQFPMPWGCDDKFALYCGRNLIAEVPESIGSLTNLGMLDVSNNNLQTLPAQLADLPNLYSLKIDKNPLAEPLSELAQRGMPDLLSYLRSLREASESQYEAKLVLVGEGNVGKSSLVASLNGDPFVSDRSTTHGIEISKLQLPHPSLQQTITLNTWDFGGQEVYRITHQFFFSRRCLYILVWRPREGQEENAIEEWCRRIRLRVGESARILIVATHADERRAELDYAYLKRQFGDIIAGRYEVDNRSGRGISQLRAAISAIAAELPQMGEKISQRWIDIRDELKLMRQPQISHDSFVQIASRHSIDHGQQSALMGLLHDLGHIIHFGDDDGLQNIVVLQPEWLTKAIGYVLEDSATETAQGVLDHRRLSDIWNSSVRDARYLPAQYPYFLRLMEKFDVSYRVPEEDSSLVAQLVPYEEPSLPWYMDTPLNPDERQLTLICRMSDAAPGLIAWLTVRNHRFSKGLHWRRGLFLEHEGHRAQALLLQQAPTELLLVVRAPSPDYFFSILRDSIESLIRRRWTGLRHSLIVPCPTTNDDNTHCSGQFELTTLQRYRERSIPVARCPQCIEEHDVGQLLTGFALSDTPLSQLLEAVNNRAMEIKSHQTWLVASQAAEVANQLRALMIAVARELPDCPRLFTLGPDDKTNLGRLDVLHSRYKLTLWCEHPGGEHPWSRAEYSFTRPKQWIVTIAPYLRILSTVLRSTVPVARAALGVALTDKEYKDIDKKLALMEALIDDIPDDIASTTIGYAGAEGAQLRALRVLLGELDPSSNFGDLRRFITPSGDYLWICSEHHREYDPGLPILPGV